jgi:hypothetical protein
VGRLSGAQIRLFLGCEQASRAIETAQRRSDR